MIIFFETVKHIYQYRTPVTLRAYSDLFIFLLPVLFSIILVGLDSIQAHLENPFDQIGEDDITINAEKFIERLSA